MDRTLRLRAWRQGGIDRFLRKALIERDIAELFLACSDRERDLSRNPLKAGPLLLRSSAVIEPSVFKSSLIVPLPSVATRIDQSTVSSQPR
jgi:hypothetical protein